MFKGPQVSLDEIIGIRSTGIYLVEKYSKCFFTKKQVLKLAISKPISLTVCYGSGIFCHGHSATFLISYFAWTKQKFQNKSYQRGLEN